MLENFWYRTLRRPYRLHTATHGEPDKPVVVLLHGIAASGEYWGKLIPLLTADYRCITIDLLGFGQSPKPQWAAYDIEQHIRSVHKAIHSLGLSGQYTLIGHSLGSLLATRYVHRYPKKVERLILLSPPIYPPLDTIEGKLALKRTDLLMRVYRTLRSSPRMTPANIRRLSKIGIIPPSVIKNPETWVPFKRSLEHCIEQQTIQRDIRAIETPIDIFYGVLDTVVVGENVRSLAKLHDVRIHTFRGNHTLGTKYANVVARFLIPKT